MTKFALFSSAERMNYDLFNAKTIVYRPYALAYPI